jgi:membrane peptidoglycan carboxypeptidase
MGISASAPIAGKTGTTNDFRDAWFVGGTPDLIAGVYIGYDDPDSLGDDETGGHIAAPVFRDFMIAALKDAPATAFRTPPGMRLYRVNPSTGVSAAAGDSTIYEAYKSGTEPGTNRKLVGPMHRALRTDVEWLVEELPHHRHPALADLEPCRAISEACKVEGTARAGSGLADRTAGPPAERGESAGLRSSCDSPLERSGFEPLVPQFSSCCARPAF